MKLLLSVLATVALSAGNVAALQPGVKLGPTYGEPDGRAYDDSDLVSADQQVKTLSICHSERVVGIGVVVQPLDDEELDLYHGRNKGCDLETLHLANDEHITTWQMETVKKHGKTRIRYVTFTTDKGNTIEGGTSSNNKSALKGDTAPDGYQLGGFIGHAVQDHVNAVGVVWTKTSADEEDEGKSAKKSKKTKKKTKKKRHKKLFGFLKRPFSKKSKKHARKG